MASAAPPGEDQRTHLRVARISAKQPGECAGSGRSGDRPRGGSALEDSQARGSWRTLGTTLAALDGVSLDARILADSVLVLLMDGAILLAELPRIVDSSQKQKKKGR